MPEGITSQQKYNKIYYQKNKEKIKKHVRDWRKANRVRYLKTQKEYCQKNKDKYKRYREVNSEFLKEWMHDYYNKNKKYLNQQCRDYYWKHKEEINQRCRIYYRKNKRDISLRLKRYNLNHRKIKNENRKLRYSADIGFKINYTFANAIRYSLKSGKGGRHWESIVGYTLQDLMQHLESQFRRGMYWQNYGKGGWEIDHIVPVSWFSFKSVHDKQFKECWSLGNLQPLWERENVIKNDRMIWEVEDAGRRQSGRHPVAVKSPDI